MFRCQYSKRFSKSGEAALRVTTVIRPVRYVRIYRDSQEIASTSNGYESVREENWLPEYQDCVPTLQMLMDARRGVEPVERRQIIDRPRPQFFVEPVSPPEDVKPSRQQTR